MREDPLLVEYKMLKALLSGSVPVYVGLPTDKQRVPVESVGVTGTWLIKRTHDLEESKIIQGWAPILTEKGAARWNALKAMFEEP